MNSILPGSFGNYISSYSYLFIAFIIFQGALVLVLFFLFLDKFISSRKVRVYEESIKAEAYKQAEAILNDTKKQSFEALRSAHTQADTIVLEARQLTKDAQVDFKDALDKMIDNHNQSLMDISTKILQEFKNTLGAESVTTIANYTSASDEIKKEVLLHVKEYSEVLRQHTLETEAVMKASLEKDMTDIKDRLKAYEDLHMRKVDERVFSILTLVSKDVLGQTMSLSDHEDLVLRLLAEAKIKTSL